MCTDLYALENIIQFKYLVNEVCTRKVLLTLPLCRVHTVVIQMCYCYKGHNYKIQILPLLAMNNVKKPQTIHIQRVAIFDDVHSGSLTKRIE